MRALVLDCEKVSYRVVYEGKTGHSRGREDEARVLEDCTLVMLAVEPGDLPRINRMAKEIRKLQRRRATSSIVINPFMHLTAEPAKPSEAQHVADALVERLTLTSEVPIFGSTFGWSKEYQLSVRAGPDSQRFVHVAGGSDES